MNKIWKMGCLVAGLIVSKKGKSYGGEAQHEKRHGDMVCS